MSLSGDVLVERRGAVARVVLNRPERLNAITVPAMRDALADSLDGLDKDPEVRVVVLTGAGTRAFTVGWDLDSLGDPVADYDDESLAQVLAQNSAALLRVWEMRQPVIAAIHGYALGAGASLALLCDLAIAAETALLGEPEIRHYALPPVLILPYLLGSKASHFYTYTGDNLTAPDMLRLGLVNSVVPAAALEDAAWEMAERIARVPPQAVQTAKRALKIAYEGWGFDRVQRDHRALDAQLLRARIPEKMRMMATLKSRGLRAFLEERDR